MFTKTAPALYRGSRADTAADVCPANSRINIVQQVRRLRAVVASSALSGFCFTVSGLLGIHASGAMDAVTPLIIGSFFSLTGVFFGAYAVGASGRVIGYLRGSEELIYFLGDKVSDLHLKVISLSLRASMKDALGAGESEDERWAEGCSSSDAIKINRFRH